MRWSSKVLCAVAAIACSQALAAAASAADPEMPWLRGSTYEPGTPTYHRWSGFYAGAQLGYSGMQTDFSRATTSLVAFSLRTLALENEQHVSQWQVLGRTDTHFASYGVFLGYNMQWDDLVLGLEFNYNRGGATAVSPVSPMTRGVAAGGNTYGVTLTGSGSLALIDYGTIRGRAGYVLGNYMPYAFAGLALGRADIARSATVSGTETTANNVVTPFSFTETDAKSGTFLTGFTLGAGLEVALLQNVFVRGEYEFIQFGATKEITANINTVRLGAGVKF